MMRRLRRGKRILIAVVGDAWWCLSCTAARYGVKLDGAAIFSTASPCYACFKRIAQVGIREVYYGTHYVGGQSVDVLRLAEEHKIHLFCVPLHEALKQWTPPPQAVSIAPTGSSSSDAER